VEKMEALLTLLGFLIASCFLLLIFKPEENIEKPIYFFCIFVSLIVITGFLLSFINRLSEIDYWQFSGITVAITSIILFLTQKRIGKRNFFTIEITLFKNYYKSIGNWFINEVTPFEKWLLSPMVITVIILGILNFVVVVTTAPHNWDSMVVHLARMAYYLQHNNLAFYDANQWAQVTHPKIQPILLIFTYLVSSRNENFTQLIQYFSYWVAIICLFGISIRAGNTKAQSLFSALIGGLLIEWIMESTTTQNDMLLTAFLGITIYSLLSFRKTNKYKYLVFAAIGVGLSIGTKEASILPLFSVGLITLFVLFSKDIRIIKRNIYIFIIFMIISLSVFSLPSGYLESNQKEGKVNISDVFTFIGKPFDYIALNGTKNLIRFVFDSISLDGLPANDEIKTIQVLLKTPLVLLVEKLGIDLESPVASAVPFSFYKKPYAHEDLSHWGVIGFGLTWISLIIVICSKKVNIENKVLAISAIFFIIIQSYFGPYDPYRGRYFISGALFSVPVIGFVIQTKNIIGRTLVWVIVILGCISGLFAVLLRNRSSFISISTNELSTTSIFSMDRMSQLTRNNPSITVPMNAYEKLVPAKAIVAAFISNDPENYEYPLFGKGLTRTILPINSFNKGFLPIPEQAEYLIYTLNGFPCASKEDISLGETWYLRKLTNTNRVCH